MSTSSTLPLISQSVEHISLTNTTVPPFTIDPNDDKFKHKSMVHQYNALPEKYRMLPPPIQDIEKRLLNKANGAQISYEPFVVQEINAKGFQLDHIGFYYRPGIESSMKYEIEFNNEDYNVTTESFIQAWGFAFRKWDTLGYHKKCGNIFDGEYCLSCAVKDVFGEAKPTITCSICQQSDIKDYYTLLCGHQHCRSCIHEWSKKQSTCPDCRSVFRMNKGWFENKYICEHCDHDHDED